MKKYLIALTLMAALTVTATTATEPQQHRHTPRTAVTDADVQNNSAQPDATANTTGKNDTAAPDTEKSGTAKDSGKKGKATVTATAKVKTKMNVDANNNEDAVDTDEGIEAYSDTTSSYPDSAESHYQYSYQVDMNEDDINHMMNGLSWIGSGMIGTLLILLILFVIAPVAILSLLFYFIYKSRKQKLQLAEMAIKNGQPLNEVLGTNKMAAPSNDILWNKGIKNVFLGIGLMFFFGFMRIKPGIGIGFLVMFYGAGQAVIARTSRKRLEGQDHEENVKDRNKSRHDFQ